MEFCEDLGCHAFCCCVDAEVALPAGEGNLISTFWKLGKREGCSYIGEPVFRASLDPDPAHAAPRYAARVRLESCCREQSGAKRDRLCKDNGEYGGWAILWGRLRDRALLSKGIEPTTLPEFTRA